MKTGTILISGFEFTAGMWQLPRPVLRAPGSPNIQNQKRLVGTPHITHSSVLTTCKGFIRTCWIFCSFCLTLFIFNWRIIALQDCVGFCHTSAWISHRYTYVPSLRPLPTPLGCYRALVWVLRVIQQIPIGYPFYIQWYVSMLPSVLSFRPILNLLPSAHVHKSRTGWTLFILLLKLLDKV